ncbi:hypothetical protein ACP26L_01240 [Paenibacillus sp. S-38]|uniref:hypothetical protein n=1 Tax=Paenibacillus sp. S-38 TaxID=3416710 RepID=UPI003CF79858
MRLIACLVMAFLIVTACSNNKKENSDLNAGNDNKIEISEKFYNDCTEALAILEDVIKNLDLFFEEESRFMSKFTDGKYNDKERYYTKQIIKIQVGYFAKLNPKDKNDPKHDVVIKESLSKIEELKEKLNLEYHSQ